MMFSQFRCSPLEATQYSRHEYDFFDNGEKSNIFVYVNVKEEVEVDKRYSRRW